MDKTFCWNARPAHAWKHFAPESGSSDNCGPTTALLSAATNLMVPFVMLCDGNSASLYVEWQKSPSQTNGCESAWLGLKHKQGGPEEAHLEGQITFAYGTFRWTTALQHGRHIDGHDLWFVDQKLLQRNIKAALMFHVAPIRSVNTALLFRRLGGDQPIRPLLYDSFASFYPLTSDNFLAQMISSSQPQL